MPLCFFGICEMGKIQIRRYVDLVSIEGYLHLSIGFIGSQLSQPCIRKCDFTSFGTFCGSPSGVIEMHFCYTVFHTVTSLYL